jgi:hypothetical protein
MGRLHISTEEMTGIGIHAVPLGTGGLPPTFVTSGELRLL